MKDILAKNKYILYSSIFAWRFLMLPLTSLAEKLEYEPLESKAFEETITKSSSLGDFLAQAFNLGLALAAALAVIMIVWGGVEYMLSESVFSKDDGKKKIKDALTGLLLALVSWLILFTINPEILNFKL